MRWHLLAFLAVAACDLFPEEAPRAQLDQNGGDASAGNAGAGGSAAAGGSTVEGGSGGTTTGGTGGIAGSGGVAGASGSGGVAGGSGGTAGTAASSGTGGDAGQSIEQVSAFIQSGEDDANVDGNDLELDRLQLWFGTGQNKNLSLVVLRFVDLQIAKGATIESARLLLFSPTEQTVDARFAFAGFDTSDCPPVTSVQLQDVTPTDATVPQQSLPIWEAESWIAIDGFGAVVQEIVDNPEWESGNALCILGRGMNQQPDLRRYAASFEGSPLHAAVLEVSFVRE